MPVAPHFCTTEPAAAEGDVTHLRTSFPQRLASVVTGLFCCTNILCGSWFCFLMLGIADKPSKWSVALQAMQQAENVTELQVPMAARVAWLNSQYTHFHQHPGKGELLRKLQKLRKIIGGKVRRGV